MKGEREEIQAALPAYEVGTELGRGAWGVVYGGRHRHLRRDVAIKQLPTAFAADASVRERFLHEARLAASLEHPHIVPVYDFVEDESGLCLIVMERCDGSLADRFRSVGLATDEACAAALATCAALSYAHGRNVLHRDIKSENLLFDGEDVLKLADFGIARALNEATRLTATGTVMGTPAYMSPEQASGEELTPASDVYSTGVMLYELLSGYLPFADADSVGTLIRKHLTEPPRPLGSVKPDVPPGVAVVVDRTLEKAPEDRFPGAVEFGVALAEAAAQAFGPGWLRERRFQLNASSEILAATERTGNGAGRAGTIVVRGRAKDQAGGVAGTAPPTGRGGAGRAGGGGSTTPPLGRDAPGGAAESPAAPTTSSVKRAPSRKVRIGAGLGIGLVAAGLLAVLLGGGGGGAGGNGAAGGASLTLGAVYGRDADDEVAIGLALDDVRKAGGVLGGAAKLLDGSSERDVDAQIKRGATVIVGPGDASETTNLLEAVDGRVVTISQTDFFERDVGAAQYYFRTKPLLSFVAYGVPDVLGDPGRVVVVDGTGAGASSGATAALLEQLLTDLGHTVDLKAAGTDPAALAAELGPAPPAAIVFVAVPDLGAFYAPLFAAGVTTQTTDIVALGDDGWVIGFPDGALNGVVGLQLDAITGKALEDRVPASQFSSDAAQAYDAVIVAALAAEAAGSSAPEAIAAQLPKVTSGKKACDSYASCLKLLHARATIDYEGVTGPLALDPKTGQRRSAFVTVHKQGDTIVDDVRDRVLVRAT